MPVFNHVLGRGSKRATSCPHALGSCKNIKYLYGKFLYNHFYFYIDTRLYLIYNTKKIY